MTQTIDMSAVSWVGPGSQGSSRSLVLVADLTLRGGSLDAGRQSPVTLPTLEFSLWKSLWPSCSLCPREPLT